MEKVSIIVPVYNGEQRLAHCVDSILQQDYPELELILVDDGSKDASFARMQEYARRDGRVRAIHKENGGVSSARNRGLEEASGSYVQFVDVDDWLPMDSTKLLVRELESSGADLAVGDFYRVVEDNVSRKGSIEKGGVLSLQDYADEMMRGPADLYFGVLWNKLYRREIIRREKLRMDEAISYSEDMIFNLEYLLHVKTVAVTKAPVYYYHYTKGSLVDQSLNLSSTVKMKTSVIGYYNNFYRNAFDARDYQERLPVIYGYLLAVSRDSLALPFAPGTRKLGTENGERVFYSPELAGSPLQSAYLSARLLERYLSTFAKTHGLDRNEALILYFLYKQGKPCSLEQIAAFTGLSRMGAALALAKLLSAGLAIHESGAGTGGRMENYRFHAPELTGELEQMERDCAAVCFEGLTQEEQQIFRRCEEKISANIRRHMGLTE